MRMHRTGFGDYSSGGSAFTGTTSWYRHLAALEISEDVRRENNSGRSRKRKFSAVITLLSLGEVASSEETPGSRYFHTLREVLR